nr:uncharacterized protein LOC103445687 [Malus domestica]
MVHKTLMNNYFNFNSVYTEEDFKCHFRMRHHVFEHLLYDVQHVNPYFRQKMDRASRPGLSPHQKVTIALRMLAYASPANAIDDTYFVQIYKEEYPREPNQADMAQLLRKAEDRGFLGMIGLLDCLHWQWKNCPTGW